MTIPDYQQLMLPVLKASNVEEVAVPVLAEKIADQYGLTNAEREQLLPSGRQRVLHNRIHWAKFYLSKAALVESPKRGTFIASQAGKLLLSSNPAEINNETLLKYPSFAEFLRGNSDKTSRESSREQAFKPTVSDVTPAEQMETAYASFSSALRSDLIKRVLDNSPSFFETLIVDLLVAMGYGGSYRDAAEQLGRSGDGGVDGVVNQDRLGLDRIYVQAKRYTNTSVGRPEVQSFVGSLVGFSATKGVFVTTSSFSQQAKDYVVSLPHKIILIDGQMLMDLMIEHNVGVRVERSFEIKRVDEDFFIEEE